MKRLIILVLFTLIIAVAGRCTSTQDGQWFYAPTNQIENGCSFVGEQPLHNATDVPLDAAIRWQPLPEYAQPTAEMTGVETGTLTAPCFATQLSVEEGDDLQLNATLQDGTNNVTIAKFNARAVITTTSTMTSTTLQPFDANITVDFDNTGKDIDVFGNSITVSTYGENSVDIVRSATSRENLGALGATSAKIPLKFNAGNIGDTQVYSSAGGGPGPRPGGVNGIEWVTQMRSIGIEPQIVLGGLAGDNDYTPSQATGMYNHFKVRGQEVTNWIIGNEPGDASSPAYCDKFSAVFDAIKTAAGSTPTSIAGHTLSHYSRGVIRQFLSDSDCAKADVIDFHDYAMGGDFIGDPYPADSATTTKRTSNWGVEVANTYADIAELAPLRVGKMVVQIGEINWSWKGANGYGGSCDPVHTPLFGHDERFYCSHNRAWSASVIGYTLKEGGRSLIYADLNGPLGIRFERGSESGAFGRSILTPMPIYWGIKAFNNFWGSNVPVTESLTDVDVFAATSGKIVIVNRRATPVDINLQLQNMNVLGAKMLRSATASPFDAPVVSNISIANGRITNQVAGLGILEIELDIPA